MGARGVGVRLADGLLQLHFPNHCGKTHYMPLKVYACKRFPTSTWGQNVCGQVPLDTIVTRFDGLSDDVSSCYHLEDLQSL